MLINLNNIQNIGIMSQTIKTELVSKKSTEQVLKYNEKVENFYKKIDSKKAAIKSKIDALKSKIVQEENKFYQTEQEGLNHKEWKIVIAAKHGLAAEEEFFSKVTAHAYAVNADKFADGEYQKQVYQINGKWYEARVAWPTAKDGGPDEEAKYFKVEEVEI